MTRSTAGAVLLVAGYAVAVAALTRLVAIYRERRARRLAVLLVATAAVAAGWALRGEPAGVILNVTILAGLTVAWWLTRPAATA